MSASWYAADRPAGPLVATPSRVVTIHPAQIISSYKTISEKYDPVIVEGAGGWEVPITENYFISSYQRWNPITGLTQQEL